MTGRAVATLSFAQQPEPDWAALIAEQDAIEAAYQRAEAPASLRDALIKAQWFMNRLARPSFTDEDAAAAADDLIAKAMAGSVDDRNRVYNDAVHFGGYGIFEPMPWQTTAEYIAVLLATKRSFEKAGLPFPEMDILKKAEPTVSGAFPARALGFGR